LFGWKDFPPTSVPQFRGSAPFVNAGTLPYRHASRCTGSLDSTAISLIFADQAVGGSTAEVAMPRRAPASL